MARPASYDRDTALAAAMSLFWDRGYHATSLKDLEAALQMKSGSIYAAFKSKQSLYEQSMRNYFELAGSAFRAEMATATSPLQGLADHIRSYANLPDDHPQARACMLMKTVIDTQTTEPELATLAGEYLADIRREITAVFEKAKAESALPKGADTDFLARRFQANINALRVELHQGTEQHLITALAEDMARDVERLRCT